MRDINILMSGVGGQGVILASDALGEIGMNNGYDVKKSDSIGMAQRGGSVVSHMRWGKRVFSPMIKKGEAHFLLGFEQLETVRWVSYLEPGGIAIIADAVIIPASVIGGTIPYPGPEEIRKILAVYTDNIYFLPAKKICAEAGNPRALNMVMLGALSVFLELKTGVWIENLRRWIPEKFIESSLKAFSLGASEIQVKK